MEKNDKYTDEFLDRFLMEDLDDDEKSAFLRDLNNDELLQKRVSQFEHCRQMVNFAYDDINKKENPSKNISGHGQWKTLAAASLLLFIGVFSGWMLKSGPFSQHPSSETWRVVLHINSNDTYLQNTLLDETQRLLEIYRKNKQKLKVEIVAYGKGVSLIQLSKSPYIERINKLTKKNPNLTIVACGRSLKRIRENNTNFKIMPNISIAPSGIRQILKRQKQGWSYIRI